MNWTPLAVVGAIVVGLLLAGRGVAAVIRIDMARYSLRVERLRGQGITTYLAARTPHTARLAEDFAASGPGEGLRRWFFIVVNEAGLQFNNLDNHTIAEIPWSVIQHLRIVDLARSANTDPRPSIQVTILRDGTSEDIDLNLRSANSYMMPTTADPSAALVDMASYRTALAEIESKRPKAS